MNIYDLPKLGENECRSSIHRTLEAFPMLRNFYDEEFVADLIRKRNNALDNYLLLRLVQPDDTSCQEFWSGIVNDLTLLEAEGALCSFKDKFCKYSLVLAAA